MFGHVKSKISRFFLSFTFFIIMFCFFCKTNLFAENNFKIEKVPDIDIRTSIIYPVQPSLKNEGMSLSSIVSLDFSSIDLNAGFRFSTDSTDSVINFLITPLKLNLFEVGAGCSYHLYDYFNSFVEHDFLLNSHIAFLKGQTFRIQLNLGTFLKGTCFKNGIITNNNWTPTLFLCFSFVWNINENFRFFISASSIDYFDYSLFGTPFFKSGVNLHFSDKLSFGADYTVKLIDMVAVAENISEMLFSLYARVSF